MPSATLTASAAFSIGKHLRADIRKSLWRLTYRLGCNLDGFCLARAPMLFGRAFEQALGALFRGEDPGAGGPQQLEDVRAAKMYLEKLIG
jgi:hypothetical protein